MNKPFVAKSLDEYVEQYTSAESPVLAALNRETNIKRGDAVMLSGHIQGALLQMISNMLRPKMVLEIGSFTGYSAICLAQGLPEDGHLHTIEQDEELEAISSAHIKKAGLDKKITQHTGSAAGIIPALGEMFDLVFIDADKVNYALYYDLVFDKVPVGGYIIADNVLYQGEVILPDEQQSKNAKAIHRFNEKVKADDRVTHFLMPVRDGLMVIRKIK